MGIEYNGVNGKAGFSDARLGNVQLNIVSTMSLTFTVTNGTWLFSLNGVTSQVKEWLDKGYKMQIGVVRYASSLEKRRRRQRLPDKNLIDLGVSNTGDTRENVNFYSGPGLSEYDYGRRGRGNNSFINDSFKTYPTSMKKIWWNPATNQYSLSTRKFLVPINKYKTYGFASMDLSELGFNVIKYFYDAYSIGTSSLLNLVYQDRSATPSQRYFYSHFGFYVTINNARFAETPVCEARYFAGADVNSGKFNNENLVPSSYSKTAYTSSKTYNSYLISSQTFSIDGLINVTIP